MHAYRTRRSLILWASLLAADACRTDEGLAPRTVRPPPGSAQVTVLPASAYTPYALPDTGYFSDVNDTQLIVGTFTSATTNSPLQAFAMQWGAGQWRLSNGSGVRSAADAVNQGGEIAGTVYDAADAPFPAVWRNVGALPEVLALQGQALDINDAGNAVGWMISKGRVFGFFWDRRGNLEKLPPFPGGFSTHAHAINIDNVVLGDATVAGSGPIPVIWTRSPSGWVPRALSGGISGGDIDNAYNVVGSTMGHASYGEPDHAGHFAVRFPSAALAVNQVGVAAGIDGSGPGSAFVADWTGQATYLPLPSGGSWTISRAFGINNCGFVVGAVLQGSLSASYPAVWDPKC